MNSITLNKNVSDEFLGDILVTAFDGQYGSSWNWFEPVRGIHMDSPHWLQTMHSETCNWKPNGRDCHCDMPVWKSAHVRLREDCKTGHPLFDSLSGFVIDHNSIAGAISRIINDEYVGTWRRATPAEEDAIDQDTLNREWRAVKTDHGTAYEVETGETARAYRSLLVKAVQDEDAGDIDADVADAIVQVAAFGKVVFG